MALSLQGLTQPNRGMKISLKALRMVNSHIHLTLARSMLSPGQRATCAKCLGAAFCDVEIWPRMARLTDTQVLLSNLKVCFKSATFFFLSSFL